MFTKGIFHNVSRNKSCLTLCINSAQHESHLSRGSLVDLDKGESERLLTI